MTTVTISRERAVELIKGYKNLFFGVTFIKRSTGSKRRMICRNGVKKHLVKDEDRKTKRKFNPADHDLINVFSVNDDAWRSIGIEGIREIRMNKTTYVVDNA